MCPERTLKCPLSHVLRECHWGSRVRLRVGVRPGPCMLPGDSHRFSPLLRVNEFSSVRDGWISILAVYLSFKRIWRGGMKNNKPFPAF